MIALMKGLGDLRAAVEEHRRDAVGRREWSKKGDEHPGVGSNLSLFAQDLHHDSGWEAAVKLLRRVEEAEVASPPN